MNMKKIVSLLPEWGFDEEYFSPFGHWAGKILPNIMDTLKDKPEGKLLLVTAINPTPLGEGKTVTSIGLSMGFNRLGKRSIATLRQPSAGPLLGIKGGATGGGKSCVLPEDFINLNFTGDFHLITQGHNAITTFFENAVFHKQVRFQRGDILWQRVMDMNDRFLRNIVVGLGGSKNGVAMESGFDITPTSEIMAIIGLSNNFQEAREKIDNILLAKRFKGDFIRFGELHLTDAVLAIIRDAFLPNVVQTTEQTPAFIHTGPFANISYGNSSIIADRIALKSCEYVVTEAGFGSDIGAEKFFHIKSREGNIQPAGIVLVVTIRGLKYQSGKLHMTGRKVPKELMEENLDLLKKGLPHLKRHLEILKLYNKPVFVALNIFPTDTEEEIRMVKECALENGTALVGESYAFTEGSRGTESLCNKIDEYLSKHEPSPDNSYVYPLKKSIKEKIALLTEKVYGASNVVYLPAALKKIDVFEEAGFGHLPLCVAKTQSSISHNPKMLGAPRNYPFEIRDVRIAYGAGYLIPVAGTMLTMPGLPSEPNARNFKVSPDGEISF